MYFLNPYDRPNTANALTEKSVVNPRSEFVGLFARTLSDVYCGTCGASLCRPSEWIWSKKMSRPRCDRGFFRTVAKVRHRGSGHGNRLMPGQTRLTIYQIKGLTMLISLSLSEPSRRCRFGRCKTMIWATGLLFLAMITSILLQCLLNRLRKLCLGLMNIVMCPGWSFCVTTQCPAMA